MVYLVTSHLMIFQLCLVHVCMYVLNYIMKQLNSLKLVITGAFAVIYCPLYSKIYI